MEETFFICTGCKQKYQLIVEGLTIFELMRCPKCHEGNGFITREDLDTELFNLYFKEINLKK